MSALAGLVLALAPALAGEHPAGEHPVELDVNRQPTLQTDGACLIRGATIHTAVEPAFVGDVLVLEGDIAAVGEVDPDLVPTGVVVIEAGEMHLAPGVVDSHSHIAIDRGVNEGTVSISAEVTIAGCSDALHLLHAADAWCRSQAGWPTT